MLDDDVDLDLSQVKIAQRVAERRVRVRKSVQTVFRRRVMPIVEKIIMKYRPADELEQTEPHPSVMYRRAIGEIRDRDAVFQTSRVAVLNEALLDREPRTHAYRRNELHELCVSRAEFRILLLFHLGCRISSLYSRLYIHKYTVIHEYSLGIFIISSFPDISASRCGGISLLLSRSPPSTLSAL